MGAACFVFALEDRLNSQTRHCTLELGLGERLGEEVCDVVIRFDWLDVNDACLLLLTSLMIVLVE